MEMEWWHWFLFAFALMGAELLTPGTFYLFFFGLGALATGLLTLLGLSSVPLEWLSFSVLSIVFVAVLRGQLLKARKRSDGASSDRDNLIGEQLRIKNEIGPDEQGQVEFRGSVWTAWNKSAKALKPGDYAKILRSEGIMLEITHSEHPHS